MHSLFFFCNIIWICINLNYDRMMIYLQEFCICLHRVFIWVFLLFIIESITWWLKNDEWKWTTQISFGWKIQSLPIYGLLIFMAYNLIAPFMTSIYHFLGMKVLCIPPINIIILQLLISTLFICIPKMHIQM